jgi:hypothetical protein
MTQSDASTTMYVPIQVSAQSGKPRVWDYLHGYDQLYTSPGVSTISDLATTHSPQPGTVVAVPRLRVACVLGDPVLSPVYPIENAENECIVTVGRVGWEPASVGAAEGATGSYGDSLFDVLLRQLAEFVFSPLAESEPDGILMLPRRQARIFSTILEIDIKALPRRGISYIGDIEDVGDD